MGKSRNRKTEKKDDPEVTIGSFSVADDQGSSAVGGVTRRNRRSKNPSTDSDADAGAGAEIPPPQLPRRRRRRHHKFFLYLAIVAVCFLLVKPLMVSISDNLRSWLIGPRETETSYDEASEIANRKILRFYQRKFAELTKESNVPGRSGIRAPRLAIVLGSMKPDPTTLKLLTLVRNLQGLGYMLTIYAMEDDGQAHSLWNRFGYQPFDLVYESADHVDWSMFEGVILSSIESKNSVSSFMKKPFCSIPLIWIIEEDELGKRLPMYAEMGWERLITEWKHAFSRADVVVFPDFSLPMLYSTLDTGNFFVVSGSPVDVWSTESYLESHTKSESNRYVLVLVIGSSFFYNKWPWDFTVAMRDLMPLLKNFTSANNPPHKSFKFVFLCGNSTDGFRDAFQEIGPRLGFPDGSIEHHGMDNDINSLLMMTDIVLYGSFQDEQGFPSLLIRAMSFEIPIIVPDLTIIKKYVKNEVHGIIFQAHNPDSLVRSFSLLAPNMELSDLARSVAYNGKLLARNILALDCITGYVKLLENLLQFPSDTMLPGSISPLQQYSWEWTLFRRRRSRSGVFWGFEKDSSPLQKPSVLNHLEGELAGTNNIENTLENEIEILKQENLTEQDWDDLRKMEIAEEFVRREVQEINQRAEKAFKSWISQRGDAQKEKKLKFETNERDEGILARIGQPLCIYEIYDGAGAWPFLHNSSLYRGLSLSTRERRSTSDDLDAVYWLSLLNDTYNRDRLCELGGMFLIAKQVDNIHRIPWIGFQSWRAAARKVSLSAKAEKVLEEAIRAETVGDVIFYWAGTDMNSRIKGWSKILNFWSLCDVLNGGLCREAFENSFRKMYGLPKEMVALPPMPDDGDHWSILHCWAMPTPSFLEFIMFSRMFVDSLDSFNHNSKVSRTCLIASTTSEEKHCYCRMLELLINVWAYHSARKMVYINPVSGFTVEHHPVEQRKGLMWAKYFNSTLLKSMDEDLAEEAEDRDHPSGRWLWPLTGDVYCKLIHDREKDDRRRQRGERQRREEAKLREKFKRGPKQTTLGKHLESIVSNHSSIHQQA